MTTREQAHALAALCARCQGPLTWDGAGKRSDYGWCCAKCGSNAPVDPRSIHAALSRVRREALGEAAEVVMRLPSPRVDGVLRAYAVDREGARNAIRALQATPTEQTPGEPARTPEDCPTCGQQVRSYDEEPSR